MTPTVQFFDSGSLVVTDHEAIQTGAPNCDGWLAFLSIDEADAWLHAALAALHEREGS